MSALLTVENLSVRLGAKDVVREASLSIASGTITALLGANGAGKSTLLRACLGLVKPNAGSVRLGGADPSALSPRERALRAAYLPQQPEAAWPVKVEALVALGRFAYGAAPDRLSAKDMEAVDRALARADLLALRNRSIDTLSGGERTRAHLARALAQGAPFLVLDEPTAALDPAHVLAVLDAAKAHAGDGGAVIFTTHDVAFAARAADQVNVLAEGRIVASGAPVETLTPDVLSRAYGRRGQLTKIEDSYAVAFF